MNQNIITDDIGIVETLILVFGSNFPEIAEPSTALKSGDRVGGIIESPISRKLFGARHVINEYIIALETECESLIRKGNLKALASLWDLTSTKLHHLQDYKTILDDLFWQSVIEVHPSAASNITSLRSGWKLVSTDGKWDNTEPAHDKSGVSRNFIQKVQSIVTGKTISVDEDDFGIAKIDEEIVGTLEDERVQTFMALQNTIKDEWSKRKLEIHSGKSPYSMSACEMHQLLLLAAHYKKLSKISYNIFWRGVRDTVTEASDLPDIALRRAWEIVRLPIMEDEDVNGLSDKLMKFLQSHFTK